MIRLNLPRILRVNGSWEARAAHYAAYRGLRAFGRNGADSVCGDSLGRAIRTEAREYRNLVWRAGRFEREALETLVDRQPNRLRCVAALSWRDVDEAAEVSGERFSRAWRRLRRCEGPAALQHAMSHRYQRRWARL